MKKFLIVLSLFIFSLELLGEEKREEATKDYLSSLREEKDRWYFMVGGLFRYILFPSYLLEPFGDFPKGAPRPFAANPGVGVSFTARKNRLDIVANLWWAGYMTDSFLYAENGEAEIDPEFIDNSLSALFLNVDFLMTVDIVPWFSFAFGGGVGLGIVFGEIRRTEAVPLRNATSGNYEGEGVGDKNWVRCIHSDNSGYCESEIGDPDEKGYYNEKEDRVPPVVPWANLLLGARFKPHQHLVIYIDSGFGIGWLIGLRVDYVF